MAVIASLLFNWLCGCRAASKGLELIGLIFRSYLRLLLWRPSRPSPVWTGRTMRLDRLVAVSTRRQEKIAHLEKTGVTFSTASAWTRFCEEEGETGNLRSTTA